MILPVPAESASQSAALLEKTKSTDHEGRCMEGHLVSGAVGRGGFGLICAVLRIPSLRRFAKGEYG